jgi:hypothetical protein
MVALSSGDVTYGLQGPPADETAILSKWTIETMDITIELCVLDKKLALNHGQTVEQRRNFRLKSPPGDRNRQTVIIDQ